MDNPDLLLAIKPVIRAFDQLTVPYYVGGSIASSVCGIARATMDADIVADLTVAQVPAFVKLLQDAFYLSEPTINATVANCSSFNLIHLETMMKVDVFIPKQDAYHQSAQARRRKDRLLESDPDSAVYVASPEDVILSKLRGYEDGGRVSKRQWLDVLGVIKVQSDSLDTKYLIHWSQALGLFESLQ